MGLLSISFALRYQMNSQINWEFQLLSAPWGLSICKNSFWSSANPEACNKKNQQKKGIQGWCKESVEAKLIFNYPSDYKDQLQCWLVKVEICLDLS